MIRPLIVAITVVILVGSGLLAWYGYSESHHKEAITLSLIEMPIIGGKTVTKERFTCCPYGHEELKDVPVRYGLPAWTPEREGQAANQEFWPGGCVVMGEKTKVVCANCRYAYDANLEYWEKRSENILGFERPLSQAIAEFPTPKIGQLKSRLNYYQRIDKDGTCSESVIYWTDLDADAVRSQVINYVKQNKAVPVEAKNRFTDRDTTTIKCPNAEGRFEIEIAYHGSSKQTFVHAKLSGVNLE